MGLHSFVFGYTTLYIHIRGVRMQEKLYTRIRCNKRTPGILSQDIKIGNFSSTFLLAEWFQWEGEIVENVLTF